MKGLLSSLIIILVASIPVLANEIDFEVKFKEDVKKARENIEIISPTKMLEMVKNEEDFLILDIRELIELVRFGKPDWKRYIHISRGKLEQLLSASGLKPQDKIVLLCKTSSRSALAGKTLKEYGFTNLMLFEGGMDEWILYNLPMTKITNSFCN